MRTSEETLYSGHAGPPGEFETPLDPGCRPGDRDARRALLLLLPGIPIALSSVTRDAAEVVMTTRAATVTWLLSGVDLVVVGLVTVAAHHWARGTGQAGSGHTVDD